MARIICFALALLAFSTAASAQELTVRPRAFALAAAYVQDAYLKPIRGRALPDMQIPSEYGPVTLSGVRLSIDGFSALDLRPGDGALVAGLAVSRISVYIAHMYIPIGRGADCVDTNILVGYNYPLPAQVALVPQALGGQLHVALRSLAFSIPASNYDSYGPDQCYGLILGNRIVRRIVENTMANANEDLAQAVRDQAADFLGGIDQALNETLRAGLDVTLPAGTPLIAAGQLNLRPYLQDVRVDSLGLRAVAQTAARRVPPSGEPGPATQSVPAFTPRFELGRIALPAAQINKILTAVFAAHAPPTWLTPDDSELVGAVFFKDNFSDALPELAAVKLDRDEFAIAPEVPAGVVPQVALTPAGALRLLLPRLILHLAYYSGGKPVPFFALELAGALDLTTKPGAPSLYLDPASTLHGSGSWEPGYTPKDPAIHQDALESFAHDFVAGLEGMNFLEQAPIGGIVFGGHEIGLMTLGFDAQRVHISIGE